MWEETELFTHINFQKLRPLSFGLYSCVYYDGIYVVKLTYNLSASITQLLLHMQTPYGFRIYGYAVNAQIPSIFYDLATSQGFYSSGRVEKNVYMHRKTDVLITEYIPPVMDPKKKYSEHYVKRMYGLARRIQEDYTQKTSEYWIDAHPWNLGKRADGSYVIIDL